MMKSKKIVLLCTLILGAMLCINALAPILGLQTASKTITNSGSVVLASPIVTPPPTSGGTTNGLYMVNAFEQSWSTADITYLRSLGFNGARVALGWSEVQPTSGSSVSSTAIAHYDASATMAQQTGFTLDIMIYWTTGRPAPSWAGGGCSFSSTFSSATQKAGYAYMWGQMAAHYANNPNVIFELLNEPGVGSGTSTSDVPAYTAFVQACVDQIRSHETVKHLILIPWLVDSGNVEITAQQLPVSQGDSNIAWVKHTYQPFAAEYDRTKTVNDHGFTGSYVNYLNWRDNNCYVKASSWGQGVINTEFGRSATRWNQASTQAWFNDVLTSMETHHYIGWTFHSYEQPDEYNLLSNVNWYMNCLTPHIGKL